MITIAKALKEKNKLKIEIIQLQKRLNTHNSVIKGNKRPFDLQELNQDLLNKTLELVQLKSALTKANQPIQEKIYKIAELKGLISFYKKVPTIEGKYKGNYSSEVEEYESYFNESVVLEKIKQLEDEVDQVQDELEVFNHTTHL